jgi:hypothetical protein
MRMLRNDFFSPYILYHFYFVVDIRILLMGLRKLNDVRLKSFIMCISSSFAVFISVNSAW